MNSKGKNVTASIKLSTLRDLSYVQTMTKLVEQLQTCTHVHHPCFGERLCVCVWGGGVTVGRGGGLDMTFKAK